MNFEKLFKEISLEEIKRSVFSLTGENFYLITAGKNDHYNSMVASGGGVGVLFKKPTFWCIIQSTRYTLELMQKIGAFTLSYFLDEHREKILHLGVKSGRDSDKMNETELTSVVMSSGNVSFAESWFILECKLTLITTPVLEDFIAEEAKDYIGQMYQDLTEYRKFVFGEIIHVWEKIKQMTVK
ncbi:MAG: hypothetical protein LBJ83_03705 [Oscillospiraceae bacterium]|jgi:flavin reductase (DIM6/NTAB) family NADH-FMN oxidoreductase RutF|nr:hypothetical protein [Oscillospiraceae bacterium]